MTITENVSLASLTTFKVGGMARYVAACENEEDIQTAHAFARERGLPWRVVGGGSNLLASDGGYAGVIIMPELRSVDFGDVTADGAIVVTAEAGVVWDALVEECAARGLWGLENLAGIPGTVGAAPVQNIGAYGAETADVLLHVDALDTETGETHRFTNAECAFSYRESRFKHDPSLIIVRAAFTLQKEGRPRIEYADLAVRSQAGERMDTPSAIATVVRSVRALKFPDLAVEGTAGSFFKNPIIPTSRYKELKASFPDLPGFVLETAGTPETKVPLAWILDHVLHLKGFSRGSVRLFERQPIVLVASSGSTSHDVDALALDIEQRVFDATGITLEREVRSL